MCHLVHRGGHRTEVLWVRPDGGAGVEVFHTRHGPGPHSLLHCAPWRAGAVDGPALGQLLAATQTAGAPRGVYVTPGEFTDCARLFAAGQPLELVDGAGLLRLVTEMPEGEREYRMRLATVGRYTAPTCPACARKMEEFDELAPPPGAWTRDMVYRKRHLIVEEHVSARELTVRKGADVRFLGDVESGNMIVRGRVEGNFLVNGLLTIHKGGGLTGLVTARAVSVEEGGECEAHARVLNDAELPRARESARRMVWRCSAWPKCAAKLPWE